MSSARDAATGCTRQKWCVLPMNHGYAHSDQPVREWTDDDDIECSLGIDCDDTLCDAHSGSGTDR